MPKRVQNYDRTVEAGFIPLLIPALTAVLGPLIGEAIKRKAFAGKGVEALGIAGGALFATEDTLKAPRRLVNSAFTELKNAPEVLARAKDVARQHGATLNKAQLGEILRQMKVKLLNNIPIHQEVPKTAGILHPFRG